MKICICVFIFVISIQVSFAQLATCSITDANGCPPNGVWGEWKTIGDSKCDMDCGGCGTLYQGRDCISYPVCNCTGDSHRYVACNFDVCKYPSQKSCCPPYLPMVLNGKSTCGPLPKTLDKAACCPQKALVSQWTGWEYVSSLWTRARNCLTASIGCPCTGVQLTQSQAACPCNKLINITDDCINVAIGDPKYFRESIVDDSSCTASFSLIGVTQGVKTYCSPMTDGYGFEMGYNGSIMVIKEVSGKCTIDTPFDCLKGAVNERQNATLTCNTDTENWIYDYTGTEVTGIVQGVWR